MLCNHDGQQLARVASVCSYSEVGSINIIML